MTVIEAEKVTDILIDAHLDGAELVVELTGRPVLYVGLYSLRHTEGCAFAEIGTDHRHRASEITIKGRKRSELL